MNISVPPVRASEPLPVQTIDVFTDTRDIPRTPARTRASAALPTG
jgi:hypothetical protein